MRSYTQKPKTTSRVIEAKPKVSRPADIKEILRTYNPNPVQKRDVVPMPARQQGQCGVLQRVIDPDVLASLSTPVYQLAGTTTCWFLSILYGIYKAGWVRDLFANDVIEVVKEGEKKYKCREGGRTIHVTDIQSKIPLWQQILEGFINHDITAGAVSFGILNNVEKPLFKNLRAVGLGGIERKPENLKAAVGALLGAISKTWTIVDAASRLPSNAAGADSPFKKMVGKPYLTPIQEDGQDILDIMTVEKTGHAMGVNAVTFTKEYLPKVSMTREIQSEKKGIKISNLQVFNQSREDHNMRKYKSITPAHVSDALPLNPIKSNLYKWVLPLNYFNYYRLARGEKFPKTLQLPVIKGAQKISK